MSPPAPSIGDSPLALTGFEVLSAVGSDARQTCAALRAKISRIAEYPHYYPTGSDPGWNDDQPLNAATVYGLSAGLSLRERMVALAARVLRQVPAQFGLSRAKLGRTALLVALPLPDEAVKQASLVDRLVPDLLFACALPPFPVTRIVPGGHTAVFELLVEAQRILGECEADSVVILAVDSYFSPQRLQLLDEAWRLRSERNVDGFIPGEAAAALLIEPMGPRKSSPSKALAILHPVGHALEPNAISSDRQSSGRALSGAIEKALGGASAARSCRWVICDMNGESYRAYEWGLAMSLLPTQLGTVVQLSHPAEGMGDVGAVSGAVLLAVAASGFARGYAPGAEALLWAASDQQTRAAIRVEAVAAQATNAKADTKGDTKNDKNERMAGHARNR